MLTLTDHPDGFYTLEIDGNRIEGGRTSITRTDMIELNVRDRPMMNVIGVHLFADLPQQIGRILFYDVDTFPSILTVFNLERDSQPDQVRIAVSPRPSYGEWKQPWSPLDYHRAIEQHINELVDSSTYLAEDFDISSTIEFGIFSIDSTITIFDILSYAMSLIKQIHDNVVAALAKELKPEEIVAFFNFPEPIRVACEQYLMYFVQFLQDFDIEAAARIEHQSSHTLMSVTPTNIEDIDTIRPLFEVFLQTATHPNFQTLTLGYKDAAVRQLEANVYMLRSQLALANAIIETKNATIETLSLARFQIHSAVGLPSSGSPAGSAEEEALIDGVLSVRKLEAPGVVLHLPEVLRKLKRRFRSDSEP